MAERSSSDGRGIEIPVCSIRLCEYDTDLSKLTSGGLHYLPVSCSKCSYTICFSCLTQLQGVQSERSKKLRIFIRCPGCSHDRGYNMDQLLIHRFYCDLIRQCKENAQLAAPDARVETYTAASSTPAAESTMDVPRDAPQREWQGVSIEKPAQGVTPSGDDAAFDQSPFEMDQFSQEDFCDMSDPLARLRASGMDNPHDMTPPEPPRSKIDATGDAVASIPEIITIDSSSLPATITPEKRNKWARGMESLRDFTPTSSPRSLFEATDNARSRSSGHFLNEPPCSRMVTRSEEATKRSKEAILSTNTKIDYRRKLRSSLPPVPPRRSAFVKAEVGLITLYLSPEKRASVPTVKSIPKSAKVRKSPHLDLRAELVLNFVHTATPMDRLSPVRSLDMYSQGTRFVSGLKPAPRRALVRSHTTPVRPRKKRRFGTFNQLTARQASLTPEDRLWCIKAGSARRCFKIGTRQFGRQGICAALQSLKTGIIVSWARTLPPEVQTVQDAKLLLQHQDSAELKYNIKANWPVWYTHPQIKVDGQVHSEKRFMDLKAGDMVTLVVSGPSRTRTVYFGWVEDEECLLQTKEQCQARGLLSPEVFSSLSDCRVMSRRVTWSRKADDLQLHREYETKHGRKSWLRESADERFEMEDITCKGGELFSSDTFLRATTPVTTQDIEGLQPFG